MGKKESCQHCDIIKGDKMRKKIFFLKDQIQEYRQKTIKKL